METAFHQGFNRGSILTRLCTIQTSNIVRFSKFLSLLFKLQSSVPFFLLCNFSSALFTVLCYKDFDIELICSLEKTTVGKITWLNVSGTKGFEIQMVGSQDKACWSQKHLSSEGTNLRINKIHFCEWMSRFPVWGVFCLKNWIERNGAPSTISLFFLSDKCLTYNVLSVSYGAELRPRYV